MVPLDSGMAGLKVDNQLAMRLTCNNPVNMQCNDRVVTGPERV